ncbi:MAG: flagellar hook-length control protein FliK [Pseudomonadota bacterium]
MSEFSPFIAVQPLPSAPPEKPVIPDAARRTASEPQDGDTSEDGDSFADTLAAIDTPDAKREEPSGDNLGERAITVIAAPVARASEIAVTDTEQSNIPAPKSGVPAQQAILPAAPIAPDVEAPAPLAAARAPAADGEAIAELPLRVGPQVPTPLGRQAQPQVPQQTAAPRPSTDTATLAAAPAAPPADTAEPELDVVALTRRDASAEIGKPAPAPLAPVAVPVATARQAQASAPPVPTATAVNLPDGTAIEPEAEPEPKLSERIGPKDAPAPAPQAQFRAAQTNANPNLAASALIDAAGKADAAIAEDPLQALQAGTGASIQGASAAPGAAAPQIAQQAAQQILTALPRDQGVIMTDTGAEIALDPPELGRVRMIVTEVAGGLALTITAERPETLDLFRRNAQLLAEEFAREGLSDASFGFQSEAEGEAQTDRDSTEAGSGPLRADARADTAAASGGLASPTAGRGGLDLRL